MKKIAIAGNEEFTIGFKLAGITDSFELGEKPMDTLADLMKSDFGIVIVEEDFLAKLDSEDRVDIENCVSPVFIPLSANASQDSLSRLIKKSIGIDLWKEND